jgi:hypothetical protein
VTRQAPAAAAVAALWLLSGVAVEVVNAWTRRRVAAQLSPGLRSRSVGWFVGSFFVRVVLTAGVLFLAFRHSFLSGAMAWLGYYVCRMALILWTSRRLERDSGRPSAAGDSGVG